MHPIYSTKPLSWNVPTNHSSFIIKIVNAYEVMWTKDNGSKYVAENP